MPHWKACWLHSAWKEAFCWRLFQAARTMGPNACSLTSRALAAIPNLGLLDSILPLADWLFCRALWIRSSMPELAETGRLLCCWATLTMIGPYALWYAFRMAASIPRLDMISWKSLFFRMFWKSCERMMFW